MKRKFVIIHENDNLMNNNGKRIIKKCSGPTVFLI